MQNAQAQAHAQPSHHVDSAAAASLTRKLAGFARHVLAEERHCGVHAALWAVRRAESGQRENNGEGQEACDPAAYQPAPERTASCAPASTGLTLGRNGSVSLISSISAQDSMPKPTRCTFVRMCGRKLVSQSCARFSILRCSLVSDVAESTARAATESRGPCAKEKEEE